MIIILIVLIICTRLIMEEIREMRHELREEIIKISGSDEEQK